MESSNTPSESSNTPSASVRDGRPVYAKPRLQVYGKLQEITQAVGNMGNLDGGPVPAGNLKRTAP